VGLKARAGAVLFEVAAVLGGAGAVRRRYPGFGLQVLKP
jgi:hypothetical protein